MKVPEKVKIGCYTVNIIPMLGFEGFAHGVYGHFSEAELCIRISTDLEPVKVANTLMHEVFHACWFVGGLDDTDEEERVVTVLANTYSAVLIDNPEYSKFINKALK